MSLLKTMSPDTAGETAERQNSRCSGEQREAEVVNSIPETNSEMYNVYRNEDSLPPILRQKRLSSTFNVNKNMLEQNHGNLSSEIFFFY